MFILCHEQHYQTANTSCDTIFVPLLTCFSLLGLDLRFDVNQQRVQRQAVGQDKVADIVATDTQ